MRLIQTQTLFVATVAGALASVASAQWQTMSPVPEARSRAAGAIVGDVFYFLGGETTGGLRNVTAWKLDLATNAWSPIADLPSIGVGNGGVSNVDAAAIGTNIYLIGGWNGTAANTRVAIYDSVGNTWSEDAANPAPTPIFANVAVAANNRVYIITGATASGILSTQMHIYDPAAASGTRWTTVAGPATGRQYAGGAVIGNKIYIGGGIGAATTTEYQTVDVYDIPTSTWSTLPNFSVPRGGTGLYNNNGNPTVVAGGWTAYRTTTETYSGGSWAADLPVTFGTRTFAYDGSATRLVKAGGWNGGFMAQTEMLSLGGGGGCYANCDSSTTTPVLNVADFTCFLQRYAAGESYANCDNSTTPPVLNVADFTCFLQRYAAGCP